MKQRPVQAWISDLWGAATHLCYIQSPINTPEEEEKENAAATHAEQLLNVDIICEAAASIQTLFSQV